MKDLENAMIGDTGRTTPETTTTIGYYYVPPAYDKEMKQFALQMTIEAEKTSTYVSEDGEHKYGTREVAQLFYEWLIAPDKIGEKND